MKLPEYEVYAIRYAHKESRRADNFIGGDPHDGPMPMDYFVWVAVHNGKAVVIDTGFTAEVAKTRARNYLRCPVDSLKLLELDGDEVEHVIITHLHFDHVGNFFRYPKASLHLQEAEMAYSTGKHMRYPRLSRGIEIEDVVGMVRMVFKGRVAFHDGDAQILPGISVHQLGGHTPGLQSVRIHTRRGWIILASDAAHYYENLSTYRPFPNATNMTDAISAMDTLRSLVDSDQYIIPGHDPEVMRRYPAVSSGLENIIVRLDVAPCE
ncbi:MAG: N-acyl homoserine lactonase family protein [Pusillimonas sp.]